MKNEMTLAFDSISENEAFARVAVAAFVTQLNPTLEDSLPRILTILRLFMVSGIWDSLMGNLCKAHTE